MMIMMTIMTLNYESATFIARPTSVEITIGSVLSLSFYSINVEVIPEVNPRDHPRVPAFDGSRKHGFAKILPVQISYQHWHESRD